MGSKAGGSRFGDSLSRVDQLLDGELEDHFVTGDEGIYPTNFIPDRAG